MEYSGISDHAEDRSCSRNTNVRNFENESPQKHEMKLLTSQPAFVRSGKLNGKGLFPLQAGEVKKDDETTCRESRGESWSPPFWAGAEEEAERAEMPKALLSVPLPGSNLLGPLHRPPSPPWQSGCKICFKTVLLIRRSFQQKSPPTASSANFHSYL